MTANVIYTAMRESAAQHRIHVTATPVVAAALPASPPPPPEQTPATAEPARKPKKAKKKSPKQAASVFRVESASRPAGPTAEEAIRERQRQTRARWAEEARQRPTEVHHHHHHHIDHGPVGQPDPAGAPGRDRSPVPEYDVVDAVVVDDDEFVGDEHGGLPRGSYGALPPGPRSDVGFKAGRDQGVRRDR